MAEIRMKPKVVLVRLNPTIYGEMGLAALWHLVEGSTSSTYTTKCGNVLNEISKGTHIVKETLDNIENNKICKKCLDSAGLEISEQVSAPDVSEDQSEEEKEEEEYEYSTEEIQKVLDKFSGFSEEIKQLGFDKKG